VGEKFPVQFGDYRLLRKVAQGGMAEIFLAQDTNGDICALKRILPHLAHQEGFIRMFIDEARIVSHLDHANVAGVYDQGKHDGFYFIAMEYVEGHSILALSERARQMKMALPRGLLAYVVADLLAGLGYAHAARDAKGRHLQIVHRDVTPQNVMISYDGVVQLIDFGVAKARARLTQTEAGFTKGKLSYMSPEQARGEPLDGRSDLFSVGIILYEITTGNRLFNKEGPGGILSAIVNDPIPLPSKKDKKYPRDLENIVMRALDKDVQRRWQTAEDMRDALLRFAKRERPKPGRARLKDLVHDLFGDPEHKQVIEQAQAVVEPTPPQVQASQVIKGESVRVKGKKIPDIETDGAMEAPAQDTHEFEAEPSAASVSMAVAAKRDVTGDAIPVLDMEIDPDDVPVPEPQIPFRVRLATRLASFGDDVAESWALNKKRYLAIIGGLSAVLLIGGMWFGGVFGRIGDAASGAAEKAREMKASAGLTNVAVDSGMRPTVLRVKTLPPGAQINIDGAGAGCVTPCDLADLDLGVRYTVELVMTGYRRLEEKVTLYPNEGTKEIEVTLERELGSVRILTEPDGASVRINGTRRRGTTPMTIDGLRAGLPTTVVVSKSGYHSKNEVVIVRDGEIVERTFMLERDKRKIPPGRVSVSTKPSGCPVRIGTRNVGLSPVSGVPLAAGTYTVIINCDNYAEDFRTVTVESGKTSRVSMSLDANVFGYLTIDVVPKQGTVVRINGQKVRTPVRFKKVVPGRHQIELDNDRLRKSKVISVDVKPNAKVTRRVNLLN